MDSDQTARLYTIGEAVDRLRAAHPDISHSSLRFLQRKGLINPARTAGGHRKFSEVDLDRVRRIKHWQGHRLSLEDIRLRLVRLDAMASSQDLSTRLLELAVQGDLSAATQLVFHADDLGFPLVRMFEDVLQPTLVTVGKMWASGALTVAEEHEITELARDLIAELTFRHSEHSESDPLQPIVVAACVAGEMHDLGLRMVVALLRTNGARVHFLGADVSPGFLVESVRQRQPQIVLLSVSLAAHLDSLRACVTTVHEDFPDGNGPVIVAGGPGLSKADHVLETEGGIVVANVALGQIVESILNAASPVS